MSNVFEEVKTLCLSVKQAAPALAMTDTDTRNNALLAMADAILSQKDAIL